jgi:hypothetical protein
LLLENALLPGEFFDRDRFQHLAFRSMNLFPHFAQEKFWFVRTPG